MILSIDTATSVCSVVLHRSVAPFALLGYSELRQDKSHATYLTVLIEELVYNTGGRLSDLKAIAISEGPGSYTGLRIGTSAAKGLCFSLDIPMIAVSSLEAIALQVAPFVNEKDLIAPMIDARRMEVYTGFYSKQLKPLKEVHPLVVEENSLDDWKAKHPTIWLAGNGAPKTREKLSDPQIVILDNMESSAKTIGELACRKFEKKEFADVAYFEPFYLKGANITVPKNKLLAPKS